MLLCFSDQLIVVVTAVFWFEKITNGIKKAVNLNLKLRSELKYLLNLRNNWEPIFKRFLNYFSIAVKHIKLWWFVKWVAN